MSTVFTTEVSNLFSQYDKGAKQERDIEITKNYYGMTGNGKVSMEFVGKPYDLTRESVRQIMGRVISDIKPASDSKVLEQCIDLIATHSPASADRLEALFVERGLIPKGFKIEGVINAINLFCNLEEKYVITKENDARFVVGETLQSSPKEILSKATKEISHNGAVSIQTITKILPETLSSETKDQFVIDVVKTVDEMTWICLDEQWFYFGSKGRNRLLQRLERIFSVVESATAENICLGMERAWNKNRKEISKVPPAEIIIKLAKTDPDYDTDGVSITAINRQHESILTEYELGLAVSLVEAEDNTLREKALEDLLVTNTKEKYAFSQALNYSPLIIKLERGVYRLVGNPL